MILDGHDTGLFPEKENNSNKYRLAPKGKGISMGVPEMTKEWKGETVYMPEAFGIKSGKSPNFGWIKSKVNSRISASLTLQQSSFQRRDLLEMLDKLAGKKLKNSIT